ncbi:MAG: Crp/Fnr family transcriptional regulator [Desulfovibrionaceae bacterium]
MRTLDAVSRIRMFEGLPEAQRSALAAISQLRSYVKGQVIFRAGDEASGFYAVVTGRVRVFRASPSGKEQILHLVEPGDAFGEVAVFEGKTFPADAETMEDSEVLFLARRDFRARVAADPELALQMLALLAGRLRGFVRQVSHLSLKEVPARLAAHLLMLRASSGVDEVRLDMTKGQVASYLGTIQETLSRALRKLEDDGLIRVQGRVITLLDPAGLEELAVEGR